MHFNTFPDDCILHIFARLPLANLLRIEIVCRKWQSLQRTACRQRHTLWLCVANDSDGSGCLLITFEDDVLVNKALYNGGIRSIYTPSRISQIVYCAELTVSICEILVEKFPNISSLQIWISYRAHTMIKLIMVLLTGWSSKLVALELSLINTDQGGKYFGDFSPEIQHEISHKYRSLLGAVNGCISLKNLDLLLCVPLPTEPNGQLDMPILAQLNQFYFYSHDQPDVLLDSLVRYAEPNANLRQIGLSQLTFSQACLDKFINLSPDLRSRFIHLFPLLFRTGASIQHYVLHPDLKSICANFITQTNFHFVNDTNMTYFNIIQQLSSLKQLIVLGLDYFKNFDQDHFEDERIGNCTIVQLPSVRVLHLDAFIHSHNILSQMNIHWVFPNLKAIHISYLEMSCVECGYRDSDNITTEQHRKCLSILLEHTKKCTQLRSIKLSKYNDVNGKDHIKWINIDGII